MSSSRALETLRQVAFVACEDTRHSRVLLEHFGIAADTGEPARLRRGPARRAHPDRMVAGEDCALVTDAGSPGISDPGEKLVAEALERGVKVVPVPGPTALVAALSASGLPTGRFHFLGFLPRKGPERQAMLEEVAPLSATLALYESPRRLAETLVDLRDALGERRAVVARELTKLHEEFVRGTLSSLGERYARRGAPGRGGGVGGGAHRRAPLERGGGAARAGGGARPGGQAQAPEHRAGPPRGLVRAGRVPARTRAQEALKALRSQKVKLIVAVKCRSLLPEA